MNVAYELGALVPSIGVGLLFWFVMRAILRADRREREMERELERKSRETALPGDKPSGMH